MEPLAAAAVLLVLLAASTAFGLLWRARQGRVSAAGTGEVIRAADLGASVAFGIQATLLQFSTEFCARCPGTRRILGREADARPGVTHVDVDLTHRRDLASRYNIMQTPTTLILDRSGRVRARIGGAPDRAELGRRLDELAAETPASASATATATATATGSRNVRTG